MSTLSNTSTCTGTVSTCTLNLLACFTEDFVIAQQHFQQNFQVYYMHIVNNYVAIYYTFWIGWLECCSIVLIWTCMHSIILIIQLTHNILHTKVDRQFLLSCIYYTITNTCKSQINSDHACIKTKKQYCLTVLVSSERSVRSPAPAPAECLRTVQAIIYLYPAR